jgi:hypothetical protein
LERAFPPSFQNLKSLLAILLLLGAVVISDAATSPRFLQNFDFDWRFQLGDGKESSAPEFDDALWRKLNVPHDFGVEGEFSETNASCTAYLPGGIAWYRKTFVASADWRDDLVSVEFDGVAMNSEVWINGHYLGKRPYAYSTFNYDLTPYLHLGGTNVIAVRVDHTEISDSRWYMGSGIYRNVWLIGTEKIHVARHGVYVTTPQVSTASAQVEIQTRVQNQTDTATEAELLTEIINANGKVVKSVTSKATIPAQEENLFSQNAEVAPPKLWSPETPNLYKVVSTVRTVNKISDRVETIFGIRSIRFDAQKGFLLNGQPMKFKGICIHHDAGALGAAVPEAVLERHLLLAKAIGCNAIRTSHNPMAPEFYDLCDRLGLMVMDEAFDEWTGAKHKWVSGWNAGVPSLHGYSEFFYKWADADLTEMIQRDRNHPCVMLWSIGNEVDYPSDPFTYPTDNNYDPNKPSAEILAKTAPRLIQVVRENDRTRPVTAALANVPASNATGLADLLDVVGYNYQAAQYEKDFAQYPDRKFFGSEDTSAMDLYEIAQNPRVAGQFLWVGFDFLGEGASWPSRGSVSGLFDTCGFLKTRSFQRAALWSEKPVVYLAIRSARGGQRGGRSFANSASHWNWHDDPRAELPVEVYSNCKSVELFLNGKSLGQKTAADGVNDLFQWNVPFKAGELKVVGTLDGKTVETSLVTADKPARIELVSDRTRLAANGQDAANVELRLVDAKGNFVPNSDALCSVEVTGAGRLVGLDNGDQRDMTPLTSPARKLNQGRALAVVESSRLAGAIELTVTAPGLPAAHLQLRAK